MARDEIRIEIDEGLELTSGRLEDAEVIFAVVDGDREDLATWLPWVDPTKSSEDTWTFVKTLLAERDRGKTRTMLIHERGAVRGRVGDGYVDLVLYSLLRREPTNGGIS